MAFADVNGKRLHYEIFGQGTPIILIHGSTNFGLSWMPQIAALVYSGYRVITPDLYGHGLSSPADHVTPVSELAEDMLELLDTLGIDRSIFCGLSLGGMVTQDLAIHAPNRVAAAIIASAFAANPGRAAAVNKWVRLLDQPHGAQHRLAATWPKLVNDAFAASPAGRAFFETWHHVLEHVDGHSLMNIVLGTVTFNVLDDLRQIECPTLVICGEADILTNPEFSEEIARGIRGAALKRIPAAGHLCCADSADLFNATIRQFLGTAKA
ncbi:MAG: alpha/beta fold hydrolase [Candidimonas sp.]|nr:MAG: alpha/beta fold hydrolase [Candidimonas sp.]